MNQGAKQSTHAERGHDLYETPACATHALLRTGELDSDHFIWEPCAGRGAISRVLEANNFAVIKSDLVAYPGADYGIFVEDFFTVQPFKVAYTTIVTNPPFMHADKFVRHGLWLGCKVVVLLRLMALEGANRSDIIDKHLVRVWAGIERLPMMHRDGWEGKKLGSTGVPFAWFVFEPAERQWPIELRRMSWRQ